MNDVLRSILYGFLLGLVQGVTEWLPVSSSGHLVAIQVWLGYEPPLLFDGLLHVASAVVVWTVVRKEMIKYLKAFLKGFASIKSKGFKKAFGTQDAMIGWYAIAALIPSFLVGFFLYKPLESLFNNLLAVGIAALVTSGILATSYFFRKGQVRDMSFPRAIAMGVAQAAAIVPGISRSCWVQRPSCS
jgi:undecaprenyl-diphosphatase